MQGPWILGAVLLVMTGVAREAEACTFDCLDAEIYPSPGVVLPRNAAVRILGSDSGPAVSVAVDGTEATFVEIPALSGDADPFALCSSGAAVRAEPMPPVGTTVTFKVQGTPDDTYAYVIGEPDFMPPAPLTDVSVDVHDYPTVDGGSNCDFNYGINLWVHLTGGVQDAGSAIVHNIYFNDKGTGDDGWLVGTVAATDGLVAVPRRYAWTEEHDPIWGFCVTVRTFDLAGNQASHAHRVCSACRARIEPGEQWGDALVTVMPAWSETDVVPGGQCSSTKFPSDEQPPPPPPVEAATESDTSVDTTAAEENDGPVERGCGCDGTGGAGSWVWGLLLVWRRRATWHVVVATQAPDISS